MTRSATLALEDLVRRMTPVSAPEDQREHLVMLMERLRQRRHDGVRARTSSVLAAVVSTWERLDVKREARERVPEEQAEPAAYRLLSSAGEEIELPESVFVLLKRVIELLARGDAVTVVPVGKELTTQQAANILNVSRQYLVRLLDDGRIPYRKTGTHRRVRMEDLIAYKRQRDRDRMASLDDLSQLSQDFGGYSELSEGG